MFPKKIWLATPPFNNVFFLSSLSTIGVKFATWLPAYLFCQISLLRSENYLNHANWLTLNQKSCKHFLSLFSYKGWLTGQIAFIFLPFFTFFLQLLSFLGQLLVLVQNAKTRWPNKSKTVRLKNDHMGEKIKDIRLKITIRPNVPIIPD